MRDTALLILAAGKGTRMQSDLPKPLVPMNGMPILGHLLGNSRKSGVAQISVVVGHKAELVREYVGEGIKTPLQEVRDGTAHAVEIAKESVQGANNLFVFVGDSPLLTAKSIQRLHQHHQTSGAACTFLTAYFEMKLPYARVIRGENNKVVACIEERDATEEQKQICEYLASHFIFSAELLWKFLPQITPHERTGERYLTDMIPLLIEAGEKVEAVSIENWQELVGLNTPEDVAWAEGLLASA